MLGAGAVQGRVARSSCLTALCPDGAEGGVGTECLTAARKGAPESCVRPVCGGHLCMGVSTNTCELCQAYPATKYSVSHPCVWQDREPRHAGQQDSDTQDTGDPRQQLTSAGVARGRPEGSISFYTKKKQKPMEGKLRQICDLFQDIGLDNSL